MHHRLRREKMQNLVENKTRCNSANKRRDQDSVDFSLQAMMFQLVVRSEVVHGLGQESIKCREKQTARTKRQRSIHERVIFFQMKRVSSRQPPWKHKFVYVIEENDKCAQRT